MLKYSATNCIVKLWGLQAIYTLYKDSYHTSQRTHCTSIKETSRLMLFVGKTPVYCENHTKQFAAHASSFSVLMSFTPITIS